MTRRLDESNIIVYLHNFDEKHIRQGNHSNKRRKDWEFSFKEIINYLKDEFPVDIEQQGTKKFALTYNYNDKYYFYIVIALKDKFINILTQYKIKKERYYGKSEFKL